MMGNLFAGQSTLGSADHNTPSTEKATLSYGHPGLPGTESPGLSAATGQKGPK